MYSRLTSMYQAKLPRRVLDLLQLKPGEVVKYEIAGGQVILSKASALEVKKLGQVKRAACERAAPEDAASAKMRAD